MTAEQRGVALGMATAMLVAVAGLSLAALLGGSSLGSAPSVELRLAVLASSALAPAAALIFCIARLARHRFITPEDIQGSGLTEGSARARLLQNTLEQSALAWPVYLAGAVLLPGALLALVPAAAAMFLIGRVLFFAGYAGGAHARAFGFALTFYPTVLLAAIPIGIAIIHLIA
ncbi:hypothetical protein KTR66_11770 [Roseococcus sp. SDR]|uniref:MAPEG family protein n=1 Tax=Roseococcus sp. SDR TaxID=2835532 RepID=UPI001BCE3D4A|nr:MAPEG family protein [Roseococcus sp. SDR]MBS7790678.1 hypothetical protein [Roseococcus sp. SDR]MBV1845992.1 hypothetical protein [Roseococcus sp. SDR]